MNISRKIKYLRLDKGWTLKEMAGQLSISESALCQIERNYKRGCQLSTAIRMAKIFNITLDELVKR